MRTELKDKDKDKEEVLEMASANSAEIVSSAQEISAAGQQLQASISEIASAAQQAASATSQSTAATRQVLSAAQVFSESASRSLARVTQAAGLLAEVRTSIDRLIDGVSLASETNIAASAAVNQVKRQSLEIQRAISTSAEIAEQISLLSFNAALEASRAGQHGAGFAVVSEEVRKLAVRAAEGAESIKGTVTEIDDAVEAIIADMNSSLEDYRGWTEQSATLSKELADSTRDVEAVRLGSSTVADQGAAIAESLTDIQNSSTLIEAATQASEQAATEASRALREQQEAFRGIHETGDELASGLDALQRGKGTAMVVEELSTVADELSATVQQTSATGAQVGVSIREIAGENRLIASNSAANTPLIQQVEGMIAEVGASASASAKSVATLRSIASETGESVATLIQGIEGASERTRGYAERIKDLTGKLFGVEETIDALTAVGIIMNVLAVNGRIEGARVGESGRSFAAVSEDIRTLSEETSRQATGIRSLLREILLAAGVVASDLERAGASARSEVERSRPVASQFLTVKDDIDIIADGAREISTAAEQATAAIGQIASGIQQIATAARQASAATTESANSAEEQAQAIAQLAEAVDELAVTIPYLR